ncbi:S-layer homology domain-containing protein [bacterium]|nr:S-layer homology domain-containing protein [bacterium]
MKLKLLFISIIFAIMFIPKAYSAEPILDVILPSSGYTDIPDNHWAYTEIKELQLIGVMAGYPDGKFRPENSITREEFATAAIKALNLDDEVVIDTLKFDDFFEGDWAWDNVQNAYYFGLLTPPRINGNGEYLFRPHDSIIRGHAITIAVNALKTTAISEKKAKAVLEYAYEDFYKIPKWFLIPAAKAQLLDMLVIDPNKYTKLIDYDKPITRAETAVLLYNMLEEAKIIPNDKIKKAMERKKVAEGHILTDAYMEDDVIAVIPKGTILPLLITGKYTSQKAVEGEKYTALVPKNFVHGKKYLLLASGTKLYGHVKKAKKGHFLIRNGVLIFENDTIEAFHQPTLHLEGIAQVKNSNSRFRKIFKGEKLKIDRGEFLEMELLQDLRIDVTTGKLIKSQDL